MSGVDHARQTARLRQAAPVQVSDPGCLGVRGRANVVAVRPSAAGRAAGARPVWPGPVNGPDAAEDIAARVSAGGPGVAPRPEILDPYVFRPPRRGTAR